MEPSKYEVKNIFVLLGATVRARDTWWVGRFLPVCDEARGRRKMGILLYRQARRYTMSTMCAALDGPGPSGLHLYDRGSSRQRVPCQLIERTRWTPEIL